MYEVVISTLSSGRVIRKRFASRAQADAFRRRAESVILRRSREGLRSARVELVVTL